MAFAPYDSRRLPRVAAGPFLDREGRRVMAKDPVCGMDVNEKNAPAMSDKGGQTHYFCSPTCKQKFEQNPQQFTGKSQPSAKHQPHTPRPQ
jgi:YHS domain-containing protein